MRRLLEGLVLAALAATGALSAVVVGIDFESNSRFSRAAHVVSGRAEFDLLHSIKNVEISGHGMYHELDSTSEPLADFFGGKRGPVCAEN